MKRPCQWLLPLWSSTSRWLTSSVVRMKLANLFLYKVLYLRPSLDSMILIGIFTCTPISCPRRIWGGKWCAPKGALYLANINWSSRFFRHKKTFGDIFFPEWTSSKFHHSGATKLHSFDEFRSRVRPLTLQFEHFSFGDLLRYLAHYKIKKQHKGCKYSIPR